MSLIVTLLVIVIVAIALGYSINYLIDLLGYLVKALMGIALVCGVCALAIAIFSAIF